MKILSKKIFILIILLYNILVYQAIGQTFNGNQLENRTSTIITPDNVLNWNQQIKINKRYISILFNTGTIHLLGTNNQFNAVIKINIIAFNKDNIPIKTFDGFELNISHQVPEQLFLQEFQSIPEIHHFEIQVSAVNVIPEPIASIVKAHIQLTINTEDELGYGIFDRNMNPIIPINLRVEPCLNCNSENLSKVVFKWELSNTDGKQFFNSYDFELLKVEPQQNGEVIINWEKASTIEVDTCVYEMTLAEGTGFYLWRVRGIGSYYSDGRSVNYNYGDWSEFITGNSGITFFNEDLTPNKTDHEINSPINVNTIDANYFYYNQFDNNINWIYNKVLTEGNRQSETITFANGLSQVLQVQTKLFSSHSVLASQNVYDYCGRPALQSLTAPINDDKLGYSLDFFKKDQTDSYTALDFDNNNNRFDPLALGFSSNNFGSPKNYYSNSNDVGIKGKYVPDSKGYPYTRTIYYNGPTGRIAITSGPGEKMRIRGGLESKNIIFSYSGVSQRELDRIFGIEAPLNNTVYKQIVTDPNKISTVSYFNSNNQIIATCLSQAIKPEALLDIGNEEENVNIDMLGKGTFSREENVFRSRTSINVENDPGKTINLNYKIKPSFFKSLCEADDSQEFCYSCDYKVEIEISYPQAANAIGRNLSISFYITPEQIANCDEQDFLTFSNFDNITFTDPPGDPDEVYESLIPEDIDDEVSDDIISLTLLKGSYVLEKRVFINNPIFEPESEQNDNPSINSYFDKYREAYIDSSQSWTAKDNCCGEIIIDTISFDCDNVSIFCTDTISDEYSVNGRIEILKSIIGALRQEQNISYKNKLINNGADLLGNHYSHCFTGNFPVCIERISGLIDELLSNPEINCDKLSDCYLIASSRLRQNIILSEQRYERTPGTDVPLEEEPLYLHDKEFDFLKSLYDCLGLGEEDPCKQYDKPCVWHNEQPDPVSGILYIQIPHPIGETYDISGMTETEIAIFEKEIGKLNKNETCLRSYLHTEYDEINDTVIVTGYNSQLSKSYREAIWRVCKCLEKSAEEETTDDEFEGGIDNTLSDIIGLCEERCESKVEAFKMEILGYIQEQNAKNEIFDESHPDWKGFEDYFPGYELECLLDIMVQQCKTQCAQLHDSRLDLERAQDTLDIEYQEYIRSEEFMHFAQENNEAFLEAFLENADIAPVGEYLNRPDKKTVQNEIIDFIYNALEFGMVSRKKTDYYQNIEDGSQFKPQLYFTNEDASAIIPYNSEKLVYRQDIKSFFYPIESVNEEIAYKYLTVVVNAIWDEGSEAVEKYRISDDKVLQYDILFVCESKTIAQFTQYAIINDNTEEPCYLSNLYENLNHLIFNLKEEIIDIYFDDFEFLHIVPSKYSCKDISNRNSVPGMLFENISPYHTLQSFSFEISEVQNGSKMKLNIDEESNDYTLIGVPPIKFDEDNNELFTTAIIDRINVTTNKYKAFLGDPNLTTQNETQVFISLDAKKTNTNPTNYKIQPFVLSGEVGLNNIISENYIPITPFSSLLSECCDTAITEISECPYGYFKVDGTYLANENQLNVAFSLNGDAAILPSGDGFLITPDSDSLMMHGSVWNKEKIDLDEPFSREFKIYLGDKDKAGGHGIAFVFHNDSSETNAIGGYDSGLAYGSLNRLNWKPVSPSLSIKIDTHWDKIDPSLKNPDKKDNWFANLFKSKKLNFEPDYIAIQKNGKIWENIIIDPVCARDECQNIEDQRIHTFKINWSGKGTKILEVFFDDELRFRTVTDIKNDIFNGSSVWWGWTGSTGINVSNEQWVKPMLTPDICKQYCEVCMKWELPDFEELIEDLGDYPPVIVYTCEGLEEEYIVDFTEFHLNQCLDQGLDALENSYYNSCGNFIDNLTISDTLGYHHYTLYYYDRAGNLVKTVPPEGVKLITEEPDFAKIGNYRNGSSTEAILPEHNLETTYEYNSIKQLISQNTPDGNKTKFWYNAAGQQVLSQDTVQAELEVYTYVKYDKLGRIIETGEISGFVPEFDDEEKQIIKELWDFINFPDGLSLAKREVIYTVYTEDADIEYAPGNTQQNLRNRISYSWRDEDGDPLTTEDQYYTYYTYDPHGNVEWLIQQIPELGRKKIRYEYDLVSGNVNRIYYQENSPEQFIHKYKYDADNRIEKVFTSTNGLIWDRDINYEYYLHGPLARAEIGEDKIQGIDYVYTIEGYLKSINQTELNPQYDPGGDGIAIDGFLKDEFSMELGYYSGDYARTGTRIGANNTSLEPYINNIVDANNYSLYNGNISYWLSNIRNGNSSSVENPIGLKSNFYKYDKINRLRKVDFKKVQGGNYQDNGRTYDEEFTYDANGNITTVNRYGWQGNGRDTDFKIDELTYNYDISVNNQLKFVNDNAGNYGSDLENQSTNNYEYDAEGKLVKDISEGLTIKWNVLNKIDTIINDTTGRVITFSYNSLGQRIAKKVFDLSNNPQSAIWYVRDVNGNILAIYTKDYTSSPSPTLLSELPIYGSNRIGIFKPELKITPFTSEITTVTADIQTELRNWLVATSPSIYGNAGIHLTFDDHDVILNTGFASDKLSESNLFLGTNLAVAEDENQQKVFEFFVTNKNEIPATLEGLRGEYFMNTTFTGNPHIVHPGENINVNFLPVFPPAPTVPAPIFRSARWTGKINIPETTDYKFTLSTSGKVKLYIDGELWIDNQEWIDDLPMDGSMFYYPFTSESKTLIAGTHDIYVEYVKIGQYIAVELFWQRYRRTSYRELSVGNVVERYFNEALPGLNNPFHIGVTSEMKLPTDNRIIEKVKNKSFSASYNGVIQLPEIDSIYTFFMKSNTGAKLFIDKKPVIDKWRNRRTKTFTTNTFIYDTVTTKKEFQIDLVQPNIGRQAVFDFWIEYWTSPVIIPRGWLNNFPPDESWLVDSKGELIENCKNIKATRHTQSIVIKAPGEYNDKYFLVNGDKQKLYFHTIHATPYYAQFTEVNHEIQNTNLSEIPHPYALAVYNDLTNIDKSRLFAAINNINTIKLYEFKVNQDGINGENLFHTISSTDTLDIGEMQISPQGNSISLSYSVVNGSNLLHKLLLFNLNPNNEDIATYNNQEYTLENELGANTIKGNNQKMQKRIISHDYSPNGRYIYYLRNACEGFTNINDCYQSTDKPLKLMRFDLSNPALNPVNIDQFYAKIFQGSLRRGKDRKLYLNIPFSSSGNENELLTFSNIISDNLDDVKRSKNSLTHIAHSNMYGLPLQTYRINPVYKVPDKSYFASRNTGKKQYELTDHLQNVRVVLGDVRQATINSGIISETFGSIKNWSDYYAYGSMIPGRYISIGKYRFGFNGMEEDNIIKGYGNSYNTMFRQFNPRTARWFSMDPITSHLISPYVAFNNNPISLADVTGSHVAVPVGIRDYDETYDVEPGKGHKSYKVYKFASYNFDNYDKYKEASEEQRNEKLVGYFELSFDVQMNNNPDILNDDERAVKFKILAKRLPQTRPAAHLFHLSDFASKNGKLKYSDPDKIVCRGGICNSASIQAHPMGPRASKGCATTPSKLYAVGKSVKKDGMVTVPGIRIQWEQHIMGLLGISKNVNERSATLVLPGKNKKYDDYKAIDFISNDDTFWGEPAERTIEID